MENISVAYDLPAKVNLTVLADASRRITVESLRWSEVTVQNISAQASLYAKTPRIRETRYVTLCPQLCEAKVWIGS